jgi:hypothetical protein
LAACAFPLDLAFAPETVVHAETFLRLRLRKKKTGGLAAARWSFRLGESAY